ncbi:unnamed protein product [Protopolystoma xenopodis]|uniref:Uncharacterized protein n=1 Tax=Protopolystoma xenopodis TaxID=117903 RepID=A0A448WGD0_9PLAT|nr:unnamed protein product [Protopolystoma xenopodis]
MGKMKEMYHMKRGHMPKSSPSRLDAIPPGSVISHRSTGRLAHICMYVVVCVCVCVHTEPVFWLGRHNSRVFSESPRARGAGGLGLDDPEASASVSGPRSCCCLSRSLSGHRQLWHNLSVGAGASEVPVPVGLTHCQRHFRPLFEASRLFGQPDQSLRSGTSTTRFSYLFLLHLVYYLIPPILATSFQSLGPSRPHEHKLIQRYYAHQFYLSSLPGQVSTHLTLLLLDQLQHILRPVVVLRAAVREHVDQTVGP